MLEIMFSKIFAWQNPKGLRVRMILPEISCCRDSMNFLSILFSLHLQLLLFIFSFFNFLHMILFHISLLFNEILCFLNYLLFQFFYYLIKLIFSIVKLFIRLQQFLFILIDEFISLYFHILYNGLLIIIFSDQLRYLFHKFEPILFNHARNLLYPSHF